MLAIHELEQRGASARDDIEAFVRDHEFPLVEGTTATFVYRGEASAVFLQHWVYGLPQEQPFSRLPESDVWYFVLDLPAKSRVEYKLCVQTGHNMRLLQDPLNPHTARDPFGANSVVYGAGYQEPDWIHPDPDARRGTIETLRLASDVFGGPPRELQVYLPARFRKTRRYPLLVVHDGFDFLRFAELQTVLDNLIHRLEIPQMIVALTQSQDRLVEYAGDPRHARFLVEELVPLLGERYPLLDRPGARGLLGSSFGAVAALSTAWRHPGYFGNLFLLSGSFAFTDIGDHDRGPLFDPVVDFVNAFRRDPGKPANRLFMTCGSFEPLIYYNRSMVPLLQSTGMTVRYREARDGHNWDNWRDRLRAGLSWLFPGPLWQVYE